MVVIIENCIMFPGNYYGRQYCDRLFFLVKFTLVCIVLYPTSIINSPVHVLHVRDLPLGALRLLPAAVGERADDRFLDHPL